MLWTNLTNDLVRLPFFALILYQARRAATHADLGHRPVDRGPLRGARRPRLVRPPGAGRGRPGASRPGAARPARRQGRLGAARLRLVLYARRPLQEHLGLLRPPAGV